MRRSRSATAHDHVDTAVDERHVGGEVHLEADRGRVLGDVEEVAAEEDLAAREVDLARPERVELAQDARSLRGRERVLAPAHRFGPGEGADDRRDRLGEDVGGGAAGPLDHREQHAVALDQLVAIEAGLAQEAFERLRRSARARTSSCLLSTSRHTTRRTGLRSSPFAAWE